MRHCFAWIIVLLLMPLSAAHADPAASSEEIYRLVADKQYPQAMQKITAGLALKGPAAKAVNRVDLYMLKGECHLQTRAVSMAADAYNSAAREADLTGDTHARLLASAHAALVKASKAFAYTPRTSPDKSRPTPIDILAPANRRQAFLAIFMDELSANDPKIKAAKTSKSLAPIAQLCKPLESMEGFELAAKEASTQAEKVTSIRKDLAESAKKLLADTLRAMSKRIGEIDKEASTYVEFYQDVSDPFAVRYRKEKVYKKKGLTDAMTKELQDTTSTCDKLPPALGDLAAGLKLEDKTFDPFSEEAARIRKEIDRILDTDYLKVYHEKPKQ